MPGRSWHSLKERFRKVVIKNIRNRYTSTLERLTDQEILDGIEEVERNFPDVIEYDHKREIIIAKKF